jgi:hypothetical protein
MISDSENVLTAVVAEAAVEEAVALIRADQDQGRLHHIVGTRDHLPDDEETRRQEEHHHAATEMSMFQEEEEMAEQKVVGTGQSPDHRQREVVVMVGAQGQVVGVSGMGDHQRVQSLDHARARLVGRSLDQGHLHVDENLQGGCRGHLREADHLL